MNTIGNETTMKLTEKEARFIEQTRRHERNWRYTRWVLVIGSILVSVAYGWLLWLSCSAIKSEGKTLDGLSLIIFLLPQVSFALTVIAVGLIIAIRDWSGSAKRELILKLIKRLEELEHDGNQ